jgi:broad specificity phosphatase PhoE
MASRLILVAHGATTGTQDLVFGDESDLTHPELVSADASRVMSWSCGPEPACVETAAGLIGQPGRAEVVADLASLDVGRWRGRPFGEVAEEDPDAVRRWMTDPSATPHGGESLARLMARVGAYCDAREWPAGRNLAVVTPLVARAMVVHALAVGPEAIFRVDLAPLGRVALSRQGPSWRLQGLG